MTTKTQSKDYSLSDVVRHFMKTDNRKPNRHKKRGNGRFVTSNYNPRSIANRSNIYIQLYRNKKRLDARWHKPQPERDPVAVALRQKEARQYRERARTAVRRRKGKNKPPFRVWLANWVKDNPERLNDFRVSIDYGRGLGPVPITCLKTTVPSSSPSMINTLILDDGPPLSRYDRNNPCNPPIAQV